MFANVCARASVPAALAKVYVDEERPIDPAKPTALQLAATEHITSTISNHTSSILPMPRTRSQLATAAASSSSVAADEGSEMECSDEVLATEQFRLTEVEWNKLITSPTQHSLIHPVLLVSDQLMSSCSFQYYLRCSRRNGVHIARVSQHQGPPGPIPQVGNTQSQLQCHNSKNPQRGVTARRTQHDVLHRPRREVLKERPGPANRGWHNKRIPVGAPCQACRSLEYTSSRSSMRGADREQPAFGENKEIQIRAKSSSGSIWTPQ
jgi:hypothetical protein